MAHTCKEEAAAAIEAVTATNYFLGFVYLDFQQQDFCRPQKISSSRRNVLLLSKMSASTSPHKGGEDETSNPSVGWVKFDETDGGGGSSEASGDQNSPVKIRTSTRSSSGVSSARGSVQSVINVEGGPVSPPPPSGGGVDSDLGGGVLPVTEVKVVNEHSLRLKKSNEIVTEAPPMFRQMQSQVAGQMDTVNLSDDGQSPSRSNDHHIRGRRFHNGEVIVTLLPVNEKWPWVNPAKFRPELVPEELMAPILTLTVEDYVQTMEKLTKDMRFNIYIIFYKRILVVWITVAFIILLSLLFSGSDGLQLFACGVAWLILNAAAIFFCMWIKIKLNKHMEKCMSSINSSLMKHNLLLGVDDRGKLSCHKVNLCFIYFESGECIKKLESILSEKPEENQNGTTPAFDREAYLRDVEQVDDTEVVVAGRPPPTSVQDRKHERAEKLFLHYLQRWAKDYLRRRLDWVVEDMYGRSDYASNTSPRHLRSALCPCQYIEEHLRNKRLRESLNPCAVSQNPCYWCD